MLFKWSNRDDHCIVSVAQSQSWSLHMSYDLFGCACLQLHVGKQEYEVYCSDEYTAGYDNLSCVTVADLYEAVVCRIFAYIQNDNPHCVDIDAIKEHLLPTFWRKWTAAGFVSPT